MNLERVDQVCHDQHVEGHRKSGTRSGLRSHRPAVRRTGPRSCPMSAKRSPARSRRALQRFSDWQLVRTTASVLRYSRLGVGSAFSYRSPAVASRRRTDSARAECESQECRRSRTVWARNFRPDVTTSSQQDHEPTLPTKRLRPWIAPGGPSAERTAASQSATHPPARLERLAGQTATSLARARRRSRGCGIDGQGAAVAMAAAVEHGPRNRLPRGCPRHAADLGLVPRWPCRRRGHPNRRHSPGVPGRFASRRSCRPRLVKPSHGRISRQTSDLERLPHGGTAFPRFVRGATDEPLLVTGGD